MMAQNICFLGGINVPNPIQIAMNPNTTLYVALNDERQS